MDKPILEAEKFLIFDTETTGFPNGKVPWDHPKQPHMVQLGCTLVDVEGNELKSLDKILKWDIEISQKMTDIHGVTTELMNETGVDPKEAMEAYDELINEADVLVAHNEPFDTNIERIVRARLGLMTRKEIDTFCTMKHARQGLGLKRPNLQATHLHLLGEGFDKAHRAIHDARATGRVLIEIIRLARSGSASFIDNPKPAPKPKKEVMARKPKPEPETDVENPFDT